MIRVNLLPPEYKTVDHAPIARIAAVLVGVLMVAGTASYWAYYHMGPLQQAIDDRKQIEERLQTQQGLANRSQALATELKQYQERRSTIEEIGRRRILWSQKLDQLADIIHANGSTQRHLAWLSSISAAPGRGPGTGGVLTIVGNSGGGSLARLSNFNADIKADEEFFDDMIRLSSPTGQRVPLDDGLQPNAAWKFNFTMILKEPGWKEKK